MMKWAAAAVAVIAFVGAGIFFAVQGLDRADMFASVGSFLLALAVAGSGAVIHLRGQKPPAPPAGPPATNHIHHNGVVVTGHHSTVTANIDRRL